MSRPEFERRTARALATIRWPGTLGILVAAAVVTFALLHGGLVAVARELP